MVSAEESSRPAPGPLEARLSAAQIDLLRSRGAEHPTVRDEVLFREGDRSYDFIVILAGTVAAIDGYGAAERELGVGYPGDFAAEPPKNAIRASGPGPRWWPGARRP